MPIERVINRTDPNPQRVDPSGDRRGRRQDQEEQKKEKDKFEKKPSRWRRLLSSDSRSTNSSLLTRKARLRLKTTPTSNEMEEEKSLTLTERFFVVWGILDEEGRPRVGVILTYTLVIGTMISALLLIIGMSLWQ